MTREKEREREKKHLYVIIQENCELELNTRLRDVISSPWNI